MDKDKIIELKSIPLRLIGEHYGFNFERVGDKYRSLCLFHNDTSTPNLFIYPDDSFFCFACRRGGNKAAFVAYAECVDKKLIEKYWEDTVPPEELISFNLEDTQADYKPQILLYLSKFFYVHHMTDPKFKLEYVKEYDMHVANRKILSLSEYSAIVADINAKLGGSRG